MAQDAVMRRLEIIGEAVKGLSSGARARGRGDGAGGYVGRRGGDRSGGRLGRGAAQGG